jgi:hypothetical protein
VSGPVALISNLAEFPEDSVGFYGASFGFGQQFKLFVATTVRKVRFKLRKNGSPTGTLTAYLYTSDGAFGSINAKADVLLATSTDTKAIGNLAGSFADVEFSFADVALAIGEYFVCVRTDDQDTEFGNVEVAVLYETSTPGYGAITVWGGVNWLSWWEWD